MYPPMIVQTVLKDRYIVWQGCKLFYRTLLGKVDLAEIRDVAYSRSMRVQGNPSVVVSVCFAHCCGPGYSLHQVYPTDTLCGQFS